MSDEKFMKFYREFKVFAIHAKAEDRDTLLGAAEMYKKLQKHKGMPVTVGLVFISFFSIFAPFLVCAVTIIACVAYYIMRKKKLEQNFSQAIDRFAEEKGISAA